MLWWALGCTARVAPVSAEPAAARVTEAVRLVSWNIETIGDPGTAQYDAALQILAHLDADVVAMQEVQWSTDAEWIGRFAADAGYSGVVTGWPVSYGDDTQLILSRLPITTSAVLDGDALSGDPLAHDLTRSIVTATVDAYGVPLLVATGHFKASDSDPDEFRRSVDAQRAASVLGADPTAAAVFCGDFNDDVASPNVPDAFFQSPVGLPREYHLGADLVAALPHGIPNSPFTPFTAAGWVVVDAAQRDGSAVTRPVSNRRLDYFVTSAALAAGAVAEVYDTHDLALPGLPMSATPPTVDTLSAADHLPVVLDLAIGDGGDVPPPPPPPPPPPVVRTVADLAPGELVITEIMPNPEPCADEVGEWIEVLVATDEPVDLTGLWMHDTEAGAPIVGGWVAEPGERVVLARTLDACGVAASATFERPLSNGGDRVALARPDGVVLDEVTFTDAPYGASLVFDGDAVCVVAGGTPGEASGCDAVVPFYDLDGLPDGGLVVSEWMPNPSVCDDNLGEWIELHNTTDGVVSLVGLQLGDLQGVAALGLTQTIEPGGWLVLGRTLDACGVGADATFAAQLANASDAVTLLRGDGTVIDAVSWIGAPSGRSLSRDANGVNCAEATPTPGADNAGCAP